MQKKLTIALASLTMSMGLIACGDDAQQGRGQMPPSAVDFAVAQTEEVPVYSTLTGRTTAVKTAEVRPQVSGVILKRMFTEGSIVQEGQQLYQIDPAIYEAQLQSAKAELAKANANLYTAKVRYNRYQKLVETNAISKQDYDDAEANFKAAEASVLVAQAVVKTAQINLNYTKVYAPISGTIGRSSVTEGALVTTGQAQQLATIQQLDPMYVDLGQSVSDHLQLKKNILNGSFDPNSDGQQASIFFENGEEFSEKGKLEFSEVNVDQSTGMLTVRVNVANPNHILLPGMYVKATIKEGIQKDAITIPQVAVTRQTNGTSIVYTVENQNCPPNVQYCVGMKVIETSGEIGNKYIIKSGVKAGDKVITSNLQKIGPGAPISPIEATTSNDQAKAE